MKSAPGMKGVAPAEDAGIWLLVLVLVLLVLLLGDGALRDGVGRGLPAMFAPGVLRSKARHRF